MQHWKVTCNVSYVTVVSEHTEEILRLEKQGKEVPSYSSQEVAKVLNHPHSLTKQPFLATYHGRTQRRHPQHTQLRTPLRLLTCFHSSWRVQHGSSTSFKETMLE